MAKKSYMNGLILGIALGVLALASSATISWLGWFDTGIIGPFSNWLAEMSWMPEFLATLSWFEYLVAGLIGAIIGIYVEVK